MEIAADGETVNVKVSAVGVMEESQVKTPTCALQ